jgi:predicted transcriptional regulator
METQKSNKRELTVKKVKDKFVVRKEVIEGLKTFNKIKKAIFSVLANDGKTIPQIADETGIENTLITYHVMSLEKFGEIEVVELNDDEFYIYQLTKK